MILISRYCQQIAYPVQSFIADSAGGKHKPCSGLFVNNLPSEEAISEHAAVNGWLVF